MKKWTWFRYLIVTVIFIVIVYKFLPYLKDFEQLSKTFNRISFIWFFAALAVQAGQYLQDGYFTKKALRILDFKIKFRNAVQIGVLDVFSAHLLPVGTFGAMVSMLYFYGKFGLDVHGVLFYNFVIGIFNVLILLFLFIFSSLLVPSSAFIVPINSYLLTAVLIIIAVVSISVFLAFRIKKVRLLMLNFLNRFHWFKSWENSMERWRQYRRLQMEHRVEFAFFVTAKSALYYLCDMFVLLAAFWSLNTHVPLTFIMFAYTMSLLVGYISFLPAGLGSADATLALIFLAMKINPLVVFSAIVFYRIVSFGIPVPVGAVSYLFLRREIRKKDMEEIEKA